MALECQNLRFDCLFLPNLFCSIHFIVNFAFASILGKKNLLFRHINNTYKLALSGEEHWSVYHISQLHRELNEYTHAVSRDTFCVQHVQVAIHCFMSCVLLRLSQNYKLHACVRCVIFFIFFYFVFFLSSKIFILHRHHCLYIINHFMSPIKSPT